MFRRLSRQRGERGSALIAVIGVMAVLLIVTLTVTGSSLQALSITTSTRAGVQAQAAAEAGIAFVMTHLGSAEACPQVPMKSTTAPIFTASIVYLSADDSEVDCAEAVRLKIVSTGTAANPGQVTTSTADTRTMEALFEFGAASTATPPSDAAIYSYSGGSFDHSSKLFAAEDSLPVVQIRTGDPSCTDDDDPSKVYIPTFDLFIADGGMSVDGSCELSANVWASGDVALNSSVEISGNLVAKTLFADSSVVIHGSVWAIGSVRLKSSVKILGTTTAGSIRLESSAVIHKNVWSAANTTLEGGSSTILGDLSTTTFTGEETDVKGQISFDGSVTAPAVPEAPVVSDWVSVGQSESEWSAFNKSAITPKTNGECTTTEVKTALEGVTEPTVLDALACKMGLTLDETLLLPNDLVILAKGFDLQASIETVTSPDTRTLWLITPNDYDISDMGNGSCNGNADGKVAHSSIGKNVLGDRVTAMLYSPCDITLGEGASWRGQLYGGSVNILKNSTLEYVYVGLPGDGDFASEGTDTGLGKQLSVRDRIGSD